MGMNVEMRVSWCCGLNKVCDLGHGRAGGVSGWGLDVSACLCTGVGDVRHMHSTHFCITCGNLYLRHRTMNKSLMCPNH